MNGRGAVEIVVAGIGLEQGLITTEVFTVLVLMAILTTAMVPVLLKVGVEWLRGRGELVDAGGTRRAVTIIGAGAVARAYAHALGDHRDVWLLDSNAGRCARARDEGLQAVVGDALDAEAMRRARADEAGLLLALTPNAEVNMLAAELAREEFAVRDLRVAQGPGQHRGAEVLMERIGADPLTDRPVDFERWGAWMETGQATPTTLEVIDEEGARDLERVLREGQDRLPLVVLRGDDAIAFPLIDRVRDGDRVMIVLRHEPGAAPEPASSSVWSASA